MKIRYLYLIPIIFVAVGLFYALILSSTDGLAGAAIPGIIIIFGLILLVGVITYHITRKVIWSIIVVTALFIALPWIIKTLDSVMYSGPPEIPSNDINLERK